MLSHSRQPDKAVFLFLYIWWPVPDLLTFSSSHLSYCNFWTSVYREATRECHISATMQPDFNNPDHEWWPRPSDGRLVPLMLQSGTDPYLLPDTSRWTRLGKPMSQVAPLVRLSNWIGSSVFIAGTRNFRLDARSLLLAALKLVVAWPLLCLLVRMHLLEPRPSSQGKY